MAEPLESSFDVTEILDARGVVVFRARRRSTGEAVVAKCTRDEIDVRECGYG